jgi:predicted molibdopterin-dependent oxidoreductase YjgC
VADDGVKALVVLADNPLFFAAGKPELAGLELLAVIDSLPTDTAKAAHVVLPDAGAFSKDGTVTSADRRVLRLQAAIAPPGEAQPAYRILGELGTRLAQRFGAGELRLNYGSPAEIMDEIAALVPLYAGATYRELESGARQPLNGLGPRTAELQTAPALPPAGDGFLLTTGRSLYTSYEGAALHSPEADKLHREEFVELHPDDARALGVANGATVTVKANGVALVLRARVTEAAQPRTLYVPLYYDGGAVTALFQPGQAVVPVEVVAAS